MERARCPDHLCQVCHCWLVPLPGWPLRAVAAQSMLRTSSSVRHWAAAQTVAPIWGLWGLNAGAPFGGSSDILSSCQNNTHATEKRLYVQMEKESGANLLDLFNISCAVEQTSDR